MKSVVITGGTKGIGASISKSFLNAGYKVIIGARKREGLATKNLKNLIFIKMDVRFEDQHKLLIESATNNNDILTCYINCAGFSNWYSISQIDNSLFTKMIDINLKGALWGCKVASASLEPGSSIINISSLAGKRGSANNSLYCATKFGLNGVTQSLAKELGPKGIRVNALCPVYVETESLLDALENNSSPSGNIKTINYLNDFAHNQSALGRLPISDEVADACLFLASKKASAITGQCINVDCGVLPQ